MPNSASKAIIERGLNWPGVANNAQLGVVYKANGNIPSMVRTSLGGTAPEIEILPTYRAMFEKVGDFVQLNP